jgi:Domain of Unknown Function (DUF748)
MESLRDLMRRVRSLPIPRRVRTICLTIIIALALYSLAGFVAVPLILWRILPPRLQADFDRPVSVGRITFNPYSLRLELYKLHISGRRGGQDFLDVAHIHLNASWSSVYRLAPIIQELSVDRPILHVVRTGKQRFNFSDMLAGGKQGTGGEASSGRAYRFSISNIRLTDGEIRFDDQVLGKRHLIENIELGIPFIANLPAALNIFVQPLLEMTVDGSPLRIAGRSKPFGSTLESDVELKLNGLDLPRYVAYAPLKLPVEITQGTLSVDLKAEFRQEQAGARLKLRGKLGLDQLDLRDAANAPLIELKRADVELADVEPLQDIARLQAIKLEGLVAHVTLKRGGTSNFSGLTAGGSATRPARAPAASPPKTAWRVSLSSFDLANGTLKLTDLSGGAPPLIANLTGIHAGLRDFQSSGQTPTRWEFGAGLASGGTLAAKGTFVPVSSQATAEVAIDGISLPPLKPLARSGLAATLATGTLTAHAKLAADFSSKKFNVRVEPADLTLANVELRDSEGQIPVKWSRAAARIERVDLASRQASLQSAEVDGLTLLVRRAREGGLNLLSLLRKTSASASPSGGSQPQASLGVGEPAVHRVAVRARKPVRPKAQAKAETGEAGEHAWQYRIAAAALKDGAINFEDATTPSPVKVALSSIDLGMKNVSGDLSKPIAINFKSKVDRSGRLQVSGTAAAAPLEARLRIRIRGLQLSPLDPYLSDRINARIAAAALAVTGHAAIARARGGLQADYRGDATLASVHLLDRLTGDSFARWRTLGFRRIRATYRSARQPKLRVGEIGLSDFQARVILNRDGRLNLADIAAGPNAPPTSITRARPEQPKPRAGAEQNGARAAKLPAADIEVGAIALNDGIINFSDNFIRPNYSADLSEIEGKIGAFGTGSTEPAAVQLHAALSGGAPIDISGAINPLAAQAFVNLDAKANGIELPGLSAYSAKYTGYPIVKGELSLNVHYLLEHKRLTAQNHIFMDQLTFGDKVESPSALNLPVRLAVALLKDPNGEIHLDVPVSGSLSNPHFSIGSAIALVFKNLILKAVTSPFSLLASAIGGSGGGIEQFNHVEFAPGLAKLTPADRQRLDLLARALSARPAVRLTIRGRVDPRVDREGLREALVEEKVRAQKLKDQGITGAAAESAQVMPDEYDKYLWRAYKATDFDKQRNLIGMVKYLPPKEMQKLMLAHTTVTDADLKRLAQARANAVRKLLSTKISPSRLVIVAPKLNAEGITGKEKTTRSDLSLE